MAGTVRVFGVALVALFGDIELLVDSSCSSPLFRSDGSRVRRRLLGLGVVLPLLGPLLSLTDKFMQLDPFSVPGLVGDLLIDGE